MNNYVLVKITGKDCKKFINTIYKKGIQFYKIKYNNDNKNVIIKISYHDYKKLLDIKTIYKIEIIKLYGFIKYKELLKQNKIFILSLILGLMLLIFLSNVILEVEIINDNKEIRELVKIELEKYDIKKYKFVKGFYQNEEIKTNILKNNKDKLEWMEIERIGNKYIVKIEQRKINNLTQNDIPQNIVASKKGIILEIKAESGEIIRKINDYVNPGDVIITGVIKNKDTLKEVIKAKGKVIAEVWYNVNVEVPINYKERKETGNNQEIFRVKFFNSLSKSRFKNSIFKDIYVIKNKLLPIEFGLYNEKEIWDIDTLYTSDQAIEIAISKAKEELKRKLGINDEIIYEKCLKIKENDSTISIDIFFKVKEDITKSEIIDINKVNEEIKK